MRKTSQQHLRLWELEVIYQGKRNKAWQYFDSAYNLADKNEIRQRVLKILRDQPVYKYIYKL